MAELVIRAADLNHFINAIAQASSEGILDNLKEKLNNLASVGDSNYREYETRCLLYRDLYFGAEHSFKFFVEKKAMSMKEISKSKRLLHKKHLALMRKFYNMSPILHKKSIREFYTGYLKRNSIKAARAYLKEASTLNYLADYLNIPLQERLVAYKKLTYEAAHTYVPFPGMARGGLNYSKVDPREPEHGRWTTNT